MKAIVVSFFVLNTLFSLPLFFIANSISNTSFIFILFFSILWFVMNRISSKMIINNLENSGFISFAVNIGLKFLASLFFVGISFYLGYFSSIYSILIFMLFYFIYTFLIAKYGVNKVF